MKTGRLLADFTSVTTCWPCLLFQFLYVTLLVIFMTTVFYPFYRLSKDTLSHYLQRTPRGLTMWYNVQYTTINHG